MGWLPYWLERLNEHKESMGNHVPRLKREPTEIFSEQCFVTMEAGEGEAFAQLAEMGLAHTVVWGSDYPHYDCTFPGALAELDERSRDILSQRWLAENKATLHELADVYGVSAERIRQLEKNAMKKIRERLGDSMAA